MIRGGKQLLSDIMTLNTVVGGTMKFRKSVTTSVVTAVYRVVPSSNYCEQLLFWCSKCCFWQKILLEISQRLCFNNLILTTSKNKDFALTPRKISINKSIGASLNTPDVSKKHLNASKLKSASKRRTSRMPTKSMVNEES